MELEQTAMEVMVAYMALAAQKEREAAADKEEAERSSWSKFKRGGMIGAAALAGGALLAITGGKGNTPFSKNTHLVLPVSAGQSVFLLRGNDFIMQGWQHQL